MDDKANVIIVGLLCVTALLALAIYKGMNGVLLTSGVGAITTIIGIFFGIKIEAKKTAAKPEEP